jgi:hypothetical protein
LPIINETKNYIMKKNYSLLIALLSPVVMGLFFAGTLYHGGSPGGRTGSPGDNSSNCTACHSGSPNNVTAWISSDIPELGYVVGDTYTITATGTHSGVASFGFELTAEDDNGNKVGHFMISTDGQTQLSNGNSSITHTASGIMPNGDTKTWSFQWTAPDTDIGFVTFYASFNAANGNGSTSGDVIYLTSLTVDESSIGLSEDVEEITFTMSPNPSVGILSVSHAYNAADIRIADLSGKIVYQQIDYSSNDKIDLSYLNQGIYLVQVQNGSKVNTQKLIIK